MGKIEVKFGNETIAADDEHWLLKVEALLGRLSNHRDGLREELAMAEQDIAGVRALLRQEEAAEAN